MQFTLRKWAYRSAFQFCPKIFYNIYISSVISSINL